MWHKTWLIACFIRVFKLIFETSCRSAHNFYHILTEKTNRVKVRVKKKSRKYKCDVCSIWSESLCQAILHGQVLQQFPFR